MTPTLQTYGGSITLDTGKREIVLIAEGSTRHATEATRVVLPLTPEQVRAMIRRMLVALADMEADRDVLPR